MDISNAAFAAVLIGSLILGYAYEWTIGLAVFSYAWVSWEQLLILERG